MKIKRLLFSMKRTREFSLFILLLVAVVQLGCAASSHVPEQKETTLNDRTALEERWGVEIQGIRLTANDFMLDFRYKIIDPEKARPLTSKEVKPNLIDQASGIKLSVPESEKLGSLRAKGKPIADRSYFILFGNPRGVVKKGSRVTVVIGDFKAENLVVE